MRRLFMLGVAAGCTVGPTQAPVVVSGLSGGGGTCDDVVPEADPFDAAMARARCEHPDMLVHPRCYVLQRVPAPKQAHLYALTMSTPMERCDLGGTTSVGIARYCVDRRGKARPIDGPASNCRE